MAGASFNPQDFIALIEQQGYVVNWYPAIVCECFKNNQPDIHCELCSGSGYRYLPCRQIKAITSSLSGGMELKVQGLQEPGSAYITPQIGNIMGYRDRIEFPEIECKYSQVLDVVGKKTTSTYRPIRRVNFVLSGNTVYEENNDFVISDDRHHLIFKEKPLTKISILYMTTPTYLVVDMSHELRSSRQNKGTRAAYTVELPKQYMIKREDFVYGQTINVKKEKIEPIDEVLTYD